MAAPASVRFAMAFLLLPVLVVKTVPQPCVCGNGVRCRCWPCSPLCQRSRLERFPLIGLFAKGKPFAGLALGMLLAALGSRWADRRQRQWAASSSAGDRSPGRQTSLSGVSQAGWRSTPMFSARCCGLAFAEMPALPPRARLPCSAVALFESAFAQRQQG